MSSSVRAGVVAIAVAALGLGLAGCGSDTETESTETAAETTTTTTSEAAPPTATPQAQGPHYTIVDYIRDNNLTEEPVKRDTPGAPVVNMPMPPGWADAGPNTPQWAYSAILFTAPEFAADPPTVVALMSKLTGDVDPAKILEFAAGEIQNLPNYEGADKGEPSQLSGFDAVQLGGLYVKDGVRRAIAQKTVVIPTEGAVYVLQLNADGREDQMGVLMDATVAIDEQTTITT
ncbi:LpqN/LpqT family lipoprotein [Mycolicibacterium sp. XJ662]